MTQGLCSPLVPWGVWGPRALAGTSRFQGVWFWGAPKAECSVSLVLETLAAWRRTPRDHTPGRRWRRSGWSPSDRAALGEPVVGPGSLRELLLRE